MEMNEKDRVLLQQYKNTGLQPWQVEGAKTSIENLKKILDGYQADRVESDEKAAAAIEYVNEEVFSQVDYSTYRCLVDLIADITDYKHDEYGRSDKEHMKKPVAPDGEDTQS